jgi:endonuclease/exonuclease/phosphatase family metal-dependent hydrolase
MKYFYFGNYRKFWDKKKIDAVIIFSRFPVVDSGFFKFPDKSLFGIFTDIAIGKDTLRIYNLHLESIRFGNDDYSFYSHLADPTEETTPLKEGTKKMFSKLRKAFIARAKEVDTLSLHINTCRYPIIMAGDFNDTPSSYAYHKLTDKLKDAYISSGKEFFGSTYAGRFPAFRIDYILYSGSFKTFEYRKFDIDLSDHYPITTTLSFNP